MAESVKDQTSKLKPDDRVGVIDIFAHDPKTDEIVLVMNEPRPWDGSEERLHQLQEKFNAYVSFLLDGELAEAGLTDDEACVLKMLFEDEGTIEDFLANPARLIGRASKLDE